MGTSVLGRNEQVVGLARATTEENRGVGGVISGGRSRKDLKDVKDSKDDGKPVLYVL
jgi:hypothetical protein